MIVVGTTLTTFAMSKDEDLWGSWFHNHEAIKSTHKVKYFAAIEIDVRGIEPFFPFLEKLLSIGGEYWEFSYNDKRTSVDSTNRIRHIAMGRNVIQDYALTLDEAGEDVTHILHLDADMRVPDDTIPKLLEMNHPIVGGDVWETYRCTGPKVDKYPFPVEQHQNTAGFLMMGRQLFSRVRWRADFNKSMTAPDNPELQRPMTEEPCMYADTLALGFPWYVRKDLTGVHYPAQVPPLEDRGYSLDVLHKWVELARNE
jgi:hypothetical protein